jgi:hypothetical protein
MIRSFFLEKEKPVTDELQEQKGNVSDSFFLETVAYVSIFLR